MPYHRITLKSLRKKDFDFEVKTIGDHIKKKRLMAGMTQKEVGERIGVSEFTIINWESGCTLPATKHLPAIVKFLGYEPEQPVPQSTAERLVAKRRTLGWSQLVAARKLGVDPGTWSIWERGGAVTTDRHRRLLVRLLGIPESALAGLNRRTE